MKKNLLFLALLLSQLGWGQSVPVQVLFLGNSYTGTNNLPAIFQNFSNAAGDSVTVQSNTPGGYTFQGHTTNATTQNLIQAGNWDYVALQEQSQIPSFPIGQVQSDCFPYAEQLDQQIRAANACTETVFYMTWGRENGDASNCASWPPICTYEGMDSLLRERYMYMAETNNAIVSPVGAVWRYIRQNHPSIDLYTGDGSHPTYAGSYAAACSFYAVIHRADPSSVSYDGSLNAAVASQIRQAAKVVVYDQLPSWFVGDYDTLPVASFTWNTMGLQVDFTNTSLNHTDVQWDFGDGQTSTQSEPTHTYAGPGAYEVKLSASRCDSVDVFSDSVLIATVPNDTTDTTLSFSELYADHALQVFPNPSQGVLHIAGATGQHLQILSLTGAVLLQRYLRGTQEGRVHSFSIQHLPAGHYVVVVTGGAHVQRSALVVTN